MQTAPHTHTTHTGTLVLTQLKLSVISHLTCRAIQERGKDTNTNFQHGIQDLHT